MPLRLPYASGATHITDADALYYLGADALATGERRFETETRGPWSLISQCRGLAVTVERDAHGYVTHYIVYGDRALTSPREAGYRLEGRVSINGTKRTAFTSSTLFELPDGRLINVAVLYCRREEGQP